MLRMLRIGWLVGGLVGWLMNWLVEWSMDSIGWLIALVGCVNSNHGYKET